jgi:hypothetical protein
MYRGAIRFLKSHRSLVRTARSLRDPVTPDANLRRAKGTPATPSTKDVNLTCRKCRARFVWRAAAQATCSARPVTCGWCGTSYEDVVVECIACPKSFIWTAGEQAFFVREKLHAPRRCKQCAKKRRAAERAAEKRPEQPPSNKLADRYARIRGHELSGGRPESNRRKF